MADDAQVEHVLKLLLCCLEALRWESVWPDMCQGTSDDDVVNHVMLYWCVPGYRRGEGRELLKESGESPAAEGRYTQGLGETSSVNTPLIYRCVRESIRWPRKCLPTG